MFSWAVNAYNRFIEENHLHQGQGGGVCMELKLFLMISNMLSMLSLKGRLLHIFPKPVKINAVVFKTQTDVLRQRAPKKVVLGLSLMIFSILIQFL